MEMEIKSRVTNFYWPLINENFVLCPIEVAYTYYRDIVEPNLSHSYEENEQEASYKIYSCPKNNHRYAKLLEDNNLSECTYEKTIDLWKSNLSQFASEYFEDDILSEVQQFLSKEKGVNVKSKHELEKEGLELKAQVVLDAEFK